MILLVIFWLLASCAFSLTRIPLEVEGKEYFVNLFTGSPPILSTKVKIDTGSSLTTLPCSLCLDCRGNSFSFYDPYKSISARLAQCKDKLDACNKQCSSQSEQTCKFLLKYAEGSKVEGTVVKDLIAFEGNEEKSYFGYFGCIESQQNKHKNNRSHMMLGLAPVPKENILYSWFEQHPEDDYRFSTCLTSQGGFLQLGQNLKDYKLQYLFQSAFNASQKKFILSDLTQIRFGKLKVREKVGLDTGAGLNYFPPNIYSQTKLILETQCRTIPFCTFEASEGFLHLTFSREIDVNYYFPPLIFKIGGHKISYYPNQYFRKSQKSGGYEFLFHSGPREVILLGAVWMQDKKITFDIKNERITVFSQYNCTYTPFLSTTQNKTIILTFQEWATTSPFFYFFIGILFLVLIAALVFCFRVKIRRLLRIGTKKLPGNEKKNEMVEQKEKPSQNNFSSNASNPTE